MATSRIGARSACLVAMSVVLTWSHHVMAQQVPFFVIVHPDNQIDMMTRGMISSLFLRTATIWADGQPAEPIDLEPSSSVREAFSREIHNRGTADVRTFWQEQVSSGALTPPPEAGDQNEAIAFVQQHRGAIAYVPMSAPLDGVKLIALVNPPVVVKKVPPTYPQQALRLRTEGDVVLRLQISEAGTVDHVEVVQGLRFGLTEAAVRAVKRWLFQPATSGGITVSAEIDVTVNFKL